MSPTRPRRVCTRRRSGGRRANCASSFRHRRSYVSESDYFEADWRNAFWGANYARLLAVKDRYDPEGLFVVHHGVGSERWSEDGFKLLS